MICPPVSLFEKRTRNFYCIVGPDATKEEIASLMQCSVSHLVTTLSHIPNLSYYTIRNRGLELLLATGSTDGKSIGFLADGDVFEILERDRIARDGTASFAARSSLSASQIPHSLSLDSRLRGDYGH